MHGGKEGRGGGDADENRLENNDGLDGDCIVFLRVRICVEEGGEEGKVGAVCLFVWE